MNIKIYVELETTEILTEKEFEKRINEIVNEDVANAHSEFYSTLLDSYSLKEVFEASEAKKDVMIAEYRETLIEDLLLNEYTFRDLEI